MKYIGIRGHRGAGKNTVAYLLANTIDYLINKKDMDQFEDRFNQWCIDFRQNEGIINYWSSDRVMIEGFGDTPKMLLSMLTGIDFRSMNDDYIKDHTYINLKDFDKVEIKDDELVPHPLYTANEYMKTTVYSTEPNVIEEDVWMTLRELILYFGIYTMQNAFGRNVWVKALVANQEYFGGLFNSDNDYKIFSDIKAKSEITYIKNKNGVIVKVSRPGHRKNGGMDLLRGDNRFDYEVVINDELETLRDTILDIAQKIIAL